MELGDQEREALSRTMHKTIQVGRFTLFEMNPVVFLSSVILIWVFVIACMVSPDYMLRGMDLAAFQWIPSAWTWLYIVSQDVWVVVLIYVMVVPKYGNLKLGKDDDQKTYSDLTWFSMLFSAGVATGLFYYAVAEPMWHYEGWGGARFVSGKKGYGNNNEDATHAMMISWYHWGIHGWIPYTTMGAVVAIMTYRRGFPMTIRYILWPLIGEKCYGIIGDVLDALSIMTTIFGVCTSLGLGAMQINAGLVRFSLGFFQGKAHNLPVNKTIAEAQCASTGRVCGENEEPYGIQNNVFTQNALIVVVTIMATMSVVIGLDKGIVNLSRFTFALGVFLMLSVLFLGETAFLLDLIVQTFGYYCWYFMKVGFYTDAYENLGSKEMGIGGAPDGLGGTRGWMSAWTIFYWGWWISWGPFVGTFLARISKGRTLRSFVLGTLVIPTLYSFAWFGILGGEGIRMQRMARTAGLCGGGSSYAAQRSVENRYKFTPSCSLDPDHNGGFGKCSEHAWERIVQVGNKCVTTTSWITLDCTQDTLPNGAKPWQNANAALLQACPDAAKDKSNDLKLIKGYGNTIVPPRCSVPVPDSTVCLYYLATEDVLFDQLASYGDKGFSDCMCAIALIALVFYFVTSSDSGSFVVDIISANGRMDPPLPQRIFWSFTEGATAIALLTAGVNLPNSQGSLRALQAASMVTGLPYTFVLCWCCQSLMILVWEETGELDVNRKAFNTFIFDVDKKLRVLIALPVPVLGLQKCIHTVGDWPLSSIPAGSWIWAVVLQLMYLLAIIFVFVGIAVRPFLAWGWSLWFGFGVFVGALRTQLRNKYAIKHGDMVTDIICGILVPWFVIAQLEDQIENPGKMPEVANAEVVVAGADNSKTTSTEVDC